MLQLLLLRWCWVSQWSNAVKYLSTSSLHIGLISAIKSSYCYYYYYCYCCCCCFFDTICCCGFVSLIVIVVLACCLIVVHVSLLSLQYCSYALQVSPGKRSPLPFV